MSSTLEVRSAFLHVEEQSMAVEGIFQSLLYRTLKGKISDIDCPMDWRTRESQGYTCKPRTEKDLE
jgi:hypothetical protein